MTHPTKQKRDAEATALFTITNALADFGGQRITADIGGRVGQAILDALRDPAVVWAIREVVKP